MQMHYLKHTTSVILDAVKFEGLVIHSRGLSIAGPPPEFFQAIEACATRTRTEVNHDGRPHFSPGQVQHVFVARNEELARFEANLSTCPTDHLLWSTCQPSHNHKTGSISFSITPLYQYHAAALKIG